LFLQEGHDWLASADSSIYFAFELIIYERMAEDLMMLDRGHVLAGRCFDTRSL
jgi:hypothetical protein